MKMIHPTRNCNRKTAINNKECERFDMRDGEKGEKSGEGVEGRGRGREKEAAEAVGVRNGKRQSEGKARGRDVQFELFLSKEISKDDFNKTK